MALTPQQGPRVFVRVNRIALQGGLRLLHKVRPQLEIAVLMLHRGVIQNVMAGQVRIKTWLRACFLNLSNQCCSGFFAQDRFGRRTGRHAHKQREQRAVIAVSSGGLVPGPGDAAVMVVHLAGHVFQPENSGPEVAGDGHRCLWQKALWRTGDCPPFGLN